MHQCSPATIVSNHKLEMGMLNGLEIKQHFHMLLSYQVEVVKWQKVKWDKVQVDMSPEEQWLGM